MKKQLVVPLQAEMFEKLGLQQPPEIEPKDRLERAGYYAALLEFWQHESPEFASYFRRWSSELRKAAARTSDADIAAVLKAVKHGYSKVGEIAEKTKLPPNTTFKILRRLLRNRLIVRTPALPDEGVGGDKRSYLYWPIEDDE